ncbi:DUF421 domain-containing protein [Henriciella litoralis]|uniref:DUF421 domain-containing protein n=1 Tax=Henriciella litoralis TaxID=568102 RepID=UPI0009FFEA4B|nr:YetF domain-containing protein [Henriciella litoralis]
MSDWITTSWTNLSMVLLSAVCIYASIIALTRIYGVRSFSKMSGFDFAVTVAIGSIVASVFIAKDPPLLQGLFALIVLYGLQMGLASLRRHFKSVENLVDNKPRLIMSGETIFDDQMRHARITRDDLYAKLREANVTSFDQVHAVIAETTGDISVLHGGPSDTLDPDLLKNVIAADRFIPRKAG